MIVAIGFTTIITALITSTFVEAAQRRRRAREAQEEDARNEGIDTRMSEIADRLERIETRLEALAAGRPERDA